MNSTYYVAIYKWGDTEDSVHGGVSGSIIYLSLQDLYGFEPEAVGYFEVAGNVITQNEFKRKHNLKSEAV